MIKIYGAGLAGLLTANVMRKRNPVILESQPALPNNHAALLRFRTDKVGRACAIPFKKVKVKKAIKYDCEIHTKPDLFFSNLYSQKVTTAILSRSIDDLESAERYVAPENLINQMANGCDIQYNQELNKYDIFDESPKISTIPMPALMKIVGWRDIPKFSSTKIYTQKAIIEDPECDVYQTIYYPDPLESHYRISIIGNVVTSEHITKPENHIGDHIMSALREDFGIKARKLNDLKSSSQKYGKIRPINEELRKEFIYEMTSKYKIYSVGRFATWRQLLLDDVVKDIEVVEKFIYNQDNYKRKMHSERS
jgi:hypothetical protein